MRNRYIAVMMTALLLLPGTNTWSGQNQAGAGGQCVKKIRSKVFPGDWLRVTAYDGDKFEGRFRKIDTKHSQLMLLPLADTGTVITTYAFDEIAKLQYRKTGKVRPEFAVGGLLLGMIAGGVIGSSTAKPGHRDALVGLGEAEGAVHGAIVGGVLGLIAGVFVSSSLESTYTVKCK